MWQADTEYPFPNTGEGFEGNSTMANEVQVQSAPEADYAGYSGMLEVVENSTDSIFNDSPGEFNAQTDRHGEDTYSRARAINPGGGFLVTRDVDLVGFSIYETAGAAATLKVNDGNGNLLLFQSFTANASVIQSVNFPIRANNGLSVVITGALAGVLHTLETKHK